MHIKINIVKSIANLAPWLAPIPSCFFVARSSIIHMELPVIMGIIIGLLIETLGFSTVHLYLMLLKWNLEKRKTDPKAPENLGLALVIFYLVITISLTVMLEIYPQLSTYAPAIFPLVALIGVFILALIVQHEQREQTVQMAKIEQSKKRGLANQIEHDKSFKVDKSDSSLDLANKVKKQNKNNVLEHLARTINEQPQIGISELKNLIGVKSRTTVYNYINELKNTGRI